MIPKDERDRVIHNLEMNPGTGEMLPLKRLAENMNEYYRGMGFPKGFVRAKFLRHIDNNAPYLNLKIGWRDVDIEEDGSISSAGSVIPGRIL